MAISIYVSSINIRSPPQVKSVEKNEKDFLPSNTFIIPISPSIIQVPCKRGYVKNPKDNLCRLAVPPVSCNHFQNCIFAKN